MEKIRQKVETILKELFKKLVIFLYNFLNSVQIKVVNFRNYFFNSTWRHILFMEIIVFIVLFLVNNLERFNIVITDDALSNIASTVGALVGGAIAILFTLSIFIMQSNADLFPTRYLRKIISSTEERIIFWSLVILSVISFIISFSANSRLNDMITIYHLFSFLVGIIFISFYLIFVFYEDLKERVNPETYLVKSRDYAIKQLNAIHRKFKTGAKIQDIIMEYEKKDKIFLIDVQYRSYPAWATIILKNIKHLYEVSLRLSSKNEIEATKIAVSCIRDIYLKYLELRNGNLSKTSLSVFMLSSTIDDQGFTTSILENLQSLSSRFLQENRKENSIHLLSIYENLLEKSLGIKFSNETRYQDNNPISSLIFGYYSGFIEAIIKTKDIDLIWTGIKSLNKMQSLILRKKDDYFLLSTLDEKLEKISLYFTENGDYKSVFIKEVANICFNRIKLSWDKYSRNEILWKSLFKNLKKHLILMSLVNTRSNFSIGELFSNFNQWQTDIINFIFEIKKDKQQKNKLDEYIILLENWSDFLLDIARDTGIANNPLGLQIIQSIEQNLSIIDFIENKADIDLMAIYKTQFNTLSWFFHNIKQIEGYHSVELDSAFEIIIFEIIKNLKNSKRVDYITNIINQYIALIDNLFEKIEDSYGYERPRIIVKLVPLGVILDKYEHKCKQQILDKIIELNDKYLEKYKAFWVLKEEKNITGPSKHQVYEEISDLKNDIFALNGMRHGINYLLNKEIKPKEWDVFVKKIIWPKSSEKKVNT